MQFNDKLVFLMNITHTSNKELANGISVDPSLISLLRTGKRKQPQNLSYINHMAAFFARRCSADFQRNALSEMLGQKSISSSMPVEVLANRLENWLTKDSDIVDHLIEGIEALPTVPHNIKKESVSPAPEKDASFYFGEEGRREVMQHMMQIIRETETPGSILVSSDDNLEWLLSDYTLTKQIQADMLEILERGFTFHQIMPAINFLPRYAEALQFWLPMYSTGRVTVYYYPRFRDNLYRRSMIILPERCMRISTAIGLGSSSDVTLFSTDPRVIHAHTMQFQEHLSLCRPALSAYSDFNDFITCITGISSKQGLRIQMMSPLSPCTLPRELLENVIKETDHPGWKSIFQVFLEVTSRFENNLKQNRVIDMVHLATADEVRSGKVYVASPFPTHPEHPCYTPETYILHLKNILRLMDRYENYYFLPYDTQENYNLLVNIDGPALLIRGSVPPLMLEFSRPEMVMACYEHLLRKAERIGYDGIHQSKNRRRILKLIQELQR